MERARTPEHLFSGALTPSMQASGVEDARTPSNSCGRCPDDTSTHTSGPYRCRGGAPGLRTDTNPPPHPSPPRRSKMWRRSGPHLAPKGPEKFCSVRWGLRFHFDVCTLKMRRMLWGIQICLQDIKIFLAPDLPSPSRPPPRLLGPDPPKGYMSFFLFGKAPTSVCSN